LAVIAPPEGVARGQQLAELPEERLETAALGDVVLRARLSA
jgi:hypothetical protein